LRTSRLRPNLLSAAAVAQVENEVLMMIQGRPFGGWARIGLAAIAICATLPRARAQECIQVRNADSEEAEALLIRADISLGPSLDVLHSGAFDKLLAVYAGTKTGAKRLQRISGCPKWPIEVETIGSQGLDGFARPDADAIHVAVNAGLINDPGAAFSVLAHMLGHAQRKRCFPSAWRSAELEEAIGREALLVFNEAKARFCGLASFAKPREPGPAKADTDKQQLQDMKAASDYWGACKPNGAEAGLDEPLLARGLCPSPNEHYSCAKATRKELSLIRANCTRAPKDQRKAASG
jgi:hypothetical protein